MTSMSSAAKEKEKKLLPGQDVEVRQLEEGLRGSWHAGVVIRIQKLQRYVEYKELLSEDGLNKLVESIQLNENVGGLSYRTGKKNKKYRGCIRPLPPALGQKWRYRYGLCVDAFYEDAWWEGILLDDLEDSEDRPVLFPDEGDMHVIRKNNLRVTQDWDEKDGTWSIRGHWVLATMRENFEREGLSIRVVWYYLREKAGFIKKVGEWTTAAREENLCVKLLKEVVAELVAQPSKQILPFMKSSTENSKLACNYSNTQELLHAELKGMNETKESEGSIVSILVQDNNLGAIVCHETSDLRGNLDSIAARDTAIALYTGEKDLMTTILGINNKSCNQPPDSDFKDQIDSRGKELCNASSSAVDLGVRVDCIDKELSNVSRRRSDLMVLTECSVNALESEKANVAEVNRRACSAGRKSCNNGSSESDFKEKIDCSDTVLLKDLLIRANPKKKKGHIDRVLTSAVADDMGLKDKSEGSEILISESSSYETCSMDKTECIDRVSSESLTRGLKDQINCTNVSELSNKVSGKCKSVALEISSKAVQKHKSQHRSTPTRIWEPPANGVTSDSKYCPLAVLNYNPTLDKNLKKEARLKAKMHLLAVGWRFEFKYRCNGGRCDTRYVSPTGRNYYSLFQACLAWKNEQKFQGLIDGSNEDNSVAEKSKNYTLENVSASLPLQKTGLRVRRNTLTSAVELGKRSQIICGSLEVARYESNNNYNAVDASKIYKGSKQWVNKGEKLHSHDIKKRTVTHEVFPFPKSTQKTIYKGLKQLVSKSEKLRSHGNKKRNVTREVFPFPESTQKTGKTGTRVLQSEYFYSNIARTNASTERSKSKKSGQGPVCNSVLSSKKRKFNTEDSPGGRKQKKAKSCCLLLKKNDKSANGYRMQVLLSTPEKSKDSSSSQGRHTVQSVLSWMIENDMVAENQRVFYWNRKENYSMAEGWITCDGILCKCCRKVYSLSNFEAHAGSKLHRPSTNLILEDGRSLLQCQMQVLDNKNRSKGCGAPSRGRRKRNAQFQSDDVCKICHFGGKLILCDHCPNSFHIECINMELVPKGKWYCPNCRCVLCGRSEFNGDPDCFTELTVIFCDQCECQYHVGCLYDRGMPKLDSCPEGNWFCSKKCSTIFSQLRDLVGMVNPLGVQGLSWTLLRSTEEDGETYDPISVEVMAEHHSKLFVALSVMHECFTPIIESRTKKDLLAELIFNRGCDRNWLNFRGFYTMILEKGDELISVATMRIHGQKVAEMPLIGTRIEYRRKGMCRLLVKELEMLLHSLGVERLILPAISELKNAWENAFGFQGMTSSERFELLQHSFVNFPDTTVLQKLLTRAGLEQEIVTETTSSKSGVEATHLSLGSRRGGLGIQEGIVPANVEMSTSKIGSSCFEVAEIVTPIRSLPCDVSTCTVSHCNAKGKVCLDDSTKLSLLRGYQHIGSASSLRKKDRIQKNTTKDVVQSKSIPGDDDLYLSKVVVGTTRSNRLVRQVKWKVAYSCFREKHKPVWSEEQSNGRECTVQRKRGEGKIYKRRRKDDTVIHDRCPVITCSDTVESSQQKDVQFSMCEIRKPDKEVSMICRKSSTTAEGNCLSTLKASASVFDRHTFLEGRSNCEASNKENIGGNSQTLSSSEHYRENDYGYLSCIKSFKYFYRRRRKQICSENCLYGEISSGVSLPVRSMHSKAVC